MSQLRPYRDKEAYEFFCSECAQLIETVELAGECPNCKRAFSIKIGSRNPAFYGKYKGTKETGTKPNA